MKERLKRKRFAQVLEERYIHSSRTKGGTATTCILKAELKLSEIPYIQSVHEKVEDYLKNNGFIQKERPFFLSDCEVTIVGVAKLNPKDKFDEKTGKKIAQAKANIKLYNLCKNLHRIYLKECIKCTKKIADFRELFEYYELKERVYLNKEKYNEICDR